MKKLLLIMLLPAFMACSTTDKETVIVTVNVENATFEEAELVYMTDFILYNRETLTAARSEDGTFTFEIKPHAPVVASLTLGEKRLPVYLERGRKLTITADMEDFDNTLVFEGTLANENKYFRLYQREMAPTYGRQAFFAKFQSASPEEFTAFAAAMEDEFALHMKTFMDQNSISSTFRRFMQTDVIYQLYSSKLMFPLYHRHYNQLEDLPEMPAGYFDFLVTAKNLGDEQLNVQSAAGFVTDYLNYFRMNNEEMIPEGLGFAETNLWIAENQLSGNAQTFAKAYSINYLLNFGDFNEAEEAYENFKADNPGLNLTEVLTTAYNNALRVKPGNAAPEFTLTDINGEEVSLSDFRDKVVYLDFWASWCGPCMREVPYAKELKKRFEGENDLVFLYVSVDEDEQAWRRTVEEREIQGVHVRVHGMSHEIAQAYNVRGVPSFFIIDRNGIIHDNNPSRPSGQTIDQELLAALAQ
jgi:thiol-disulfide isomerase/thioredoxin